jgi:hypothetical protein
MTEIAIRRRETHIFPRDTREHYIEPEWVSQRLFDVEPFVGEVFDPACGLGRIVQCAVGRDIATGDDFFDSTRAVCNVVSNPPFGPRGVTAKRFALHALDLARHKVALIYPVASLNAAHYWLKDTPLARVLLLTPRPSMPPAHIILAGIKPGGGRPDYCWLIWSQGHNGRPELHWLHRDRGAP